MNLARPEHPCYTLPRGGQVHETCHLLRLNGACMSPLTRYCPLAMGSPESFLFVPRNKSARRASHLHHTAGAVSAHWLQRPLWGLPRQESPESSPSDRPSERWSCRESAKRSGYSRCCACRAHESPLSGPSSTSSLYSFLSTYIFSTRIQMLRSPARDTLLMMHTATAEAHPNIAFTICRLAKLGRTNRKVCFGGKIIP
jgi:hypothetical protein